MLFILVLIASEVLGNQQHDCRKLFNPHNYMDKLPSLSLPYVQNVNYVSSIRPSPVITTKVINVVTKYVYKNPVCIKVNGKKPKCKGQNTNAENSNNNPEHLVTKEYFVRDRKHKQADLTQNAESQDILQMFMQGSEEPTPFSVQSKTPSLSSEDVKDMLIEDRLDQLETILPHYTRRRVYETQSVTVTKVRSNNKATATLLVKNCIPQGYDLCPQSQKIKQRNSKVAKFNNNTNNEWNYFG